MSSEKPLVYLILGATGSGRRTLVADLIEGGLGESDRAVVLLPAGEPADETDARLGTPGRWSLAEGAIDTPDGLPEDATHIFFIADGRGNPVDQIEAFKPWMEAQNGELGAVICVVNCGLAEAHRELATWFDACIHFSDAVVLARREGVANKWLTGFQNRYKDQFYPCLFELLKNDRVKNPAVLLDPVPRRMSHFFDEAEWLVEGNDAGDDIEAGEGDGEEPTDLDEEVEVTQAADPYMERRAGGRRVKELPDIARFLEPPGKPAAGDSTK